MEHCHGGSVYCKAGNSKTYDSIRKVYGTRDSVPLSDSYSTPKSVIYSHEHEGV